MKTSRNYILTFAFLVALLVPNTVIHAATTQSLSTRIQNLSAQATALQRELNAMRYQPTVNSGVFLMSDVYSSDVYAVQRILATDPSIYPEGLVTGYFGPLTRSAIMRFQARHSLAVTGIIDQQTRSLILGCQNYSYTTKAFCGATPVTYVGGTGRYNNLSYVYYSPTRGYAFNVDIDVDTEYKTTVVSFTFDYQNYRVWVDSTSERVVLREIADELDVRVQNLDDNLVDEIKDSLRDAVRDARDNRSNKQDAEDAIDDALDAINDAQDEIYDDRGDTDDAEDLLERAYDKLNDAYNALDNRDYGDAEKYAKSARKLAGDAEDEL